MKKYFLAIIIMSLSLSASASSSCKSHVEYTARFMAEVNAGEFYIRDVDTELQSKSGSKWTYKVKVSGVSSGELLEGEYLITADTKFNNRPCAISKVVSVKQDGYWPYD